MALLNGNVSETLLIIVLFVIFAIGPIYLILIGSHFDPNEDNISRTRLIEEIQFELVHSYEHQSCSTDATAECTRLQATYCNGTTSELFSESELISCDLSGDNSGEDN